MTREEIDVLWQKAMYSAIKSDEPSTRYGFANLILEAAALKCDEQQLEPECPERASYCAESIRSMKV